MAALTAGQTRLAENGEAAGTEVRSGGYWLLLTVLGACLFLAQLPALGQATHDDAFISFRFARNLAAGHGLTFNAGEPGVEGYSNLLWILLLAAGSRLSGDLPMLALALGIGCTLAHLALLAWIATRLGRYAWVPVLLTATSAPVGASAVQGLETPLAALLTTAAVWSFCREKPACGSHLLRTALLGFLLSLTRSEGPLLFGLLTLLRLPRPGILRQREFWRSWLLPFALLSSAYTLFRWQVFGQFLPQAFYVRVGTHGVDWVERLNFGVSYVGVNMTTNGAWGLGLLAGLIALRRPLARRLLVVASGSLLFLVAIGGDPACIRHGRFVVPIAGLLALLLQQGLQLAADRGGRIVATCLALSALACNGWTADSHVEWKVARTSMGQLLPGLPTAAGPSERTGAGSSPGASPILEPGFSNPGPPAPSGGWPGGPGAAVIQARRFLDTRGYESLRWCFDAWVGLHLARTWPAGGELVSGQAGHLAYCWERPFQDWFGLATARPARPWEEPAPASRFYAVFQEAASDKSPLDRDLYRLAGAGLSVARVYLQLSREPGSPYRGFVIMAAPPEGAVLLPPSEESASMASLWPLLPAGRVVLYADGWVEGPVWDGPGGRAERERFGLLPAAAEPWLRSAAGGLADLSR